MTDTRMLAGREIYPIGFGAMRGLWVSLVVPVVFGCTPVVVESSPEQTAVHELQVREHRRGEALKQRIRKSSSEALCTELTASPAADQTSLLIEAEMVFRGKFDCLGVSIGSFSTSLLGKRQFDRSQRVPDYTRSTDYDCSDFGSEADAQIFFLSLGGPIFDEHDLDRDGDGLACEWGPQIRKVASSNFRPDSVSKPLIPKRSGRSLKTCFTGPRGGTYTITASGRKNYSGC